LRYPPFTKAFPAVEWGICQVRGVPVVVVHNFKGLRGSLSLVVVASELVGEFSCGVG
jgi:hypothetical protein